MKVYCCGGGGEINTKVNPPKQSPNKENIKTEKK